MGPHLPSPPDTVSSYNSALYLLRVSISVSVNEPLIPTDFYTFFFGSAFRPLPHSLVRHNSDVCLIVKDLNRKDRDYQPTIKHYKKLLKTNGIKSVFEVKQKKQQTGMHSSRIRTGRSLTVCRSLLPKKMQKKKTKKNAKKKGKKFFFGGGVCSALEGVSGPGGCLL